MKKLILVILVLPSILFPQEKTYEMEIKDGVKYVHNIKPKYNKPIVKLEFVQRIGELEPDDENYMLGLANGVLIDYEGNIYILDSINQSISIFSQNGKFITKFGNKGQGPGEFFRPELMDIDKSNNLYVLDPESFKIEIFNPSHKYLKRIVLRSFVGTFKVIEKDKIVTQYLSILRNDNKNSPSLCLINSNGEVIKEFGETFEPNDKRLKDAVNKVIINTDERKNIYVTYNRLNRIEKYSEDCILIMRIERPLNYLIDHKIVKRTISVGKKTSTGISYDLTQVSSDIHVDYKERLWVTTVTVQRQRNKNFKVIKNEKKYIEIFDKEGILLGYIEFPIEKSDLICIKNSRVFFTDSSGISVHEYKIVELQ